MKQKRKNHSSEFKARVALEAIKGIKTIQQIALENGLHPVQVSRWKSQMQDSAAGVFEKEPSRVDHKTEQEKSRLERKVGQLVVELDWLKKKCEQLGIDP